MKGGQVRRTLWEVLEAWKIHYRDERGSVPRRIIRKEKKRLSSHVCADLPVLYAVRTDVIWHLWAIASRFPAATVIAGSFHVSLLVGDRRTGEGLRPGGGRTRRGEASGGSVASGGDRRHGQIEIRLVHLEQSSFQSRGPSSSGGTWPGLTRLGQKKEGR